jgi:hypothetical protein
MAKIIEFIVDELRAPENYENCWGCVLLDSCFTHQLRCDTSMEALLEGKKEWGLKLPTPKPTIVKGGN